MQLAREVVLTVASWLVGSSFALAQDPPSGLDDPLLGIAVRIAPLSDVDMHGGEIRSGDRIEPEFDFDGETDVGFGAELSYTHPIASFFALGVQMGAHTWEWDFGSLRRRDLVATVSLAPRLRFQPSDAFELYASVAVGLGMLWTGEVDPPGATVPDGSREIEFGLGWHVAPMVGARLAADRDYGVFFELGAALHGFSHEVQVIVDDQGTEVPNTTDTAVDQLVCLLGVFFNLDTQRD